MYSRRPETREKSITEVLGGGLAPSGGLDNGVCREGRAEGTGSSRQGQRP